MKPIARKAQIATEDLFEEVLVYDMKHHRAHCLNQTAAAVWRYCDGRNSPAEIAERLREELGLAADEYLVGEALRQLRQAELIEPKSIQRSAALPSRREIGRRLSTAALAIPLVTSIVVPTAAMAQSLAGAGATGDDEGGDTGGPAGDEGGGNGGSNADGRGKHTRRRRRKHWL